MKRIFSLLLAAALLLGCFPAAALAAETGLQEAPSPTLIPVETDLPDSDELFAGYVEQVFYGCSSTFGTAAGRRLTGDCKKIYDAIVPILKKIASGKRSSTVITIGPGSADATASFSGSGLSNSEALNLVFALLSDLPYDLYWFDKTQGFYYNTTVASGRMTKIEFGFVVASAYAAGTYTASTSKTGAAARAAANAKTIANRYASGSDYDKLSGFCNAICDLTNYNYSAVNNAYTPYGDPWQLIHVFDGDASTKVVCEGYSKAFLYLCDLSSFTGNVLVNTVIGHMDGGAHMWNIVTMEDTNYLVDVTNYDGGYDLFMVGGSGSITRGYKVKGFTYTYDSFTTDLWGTGSGSILKLTSADYVNHSFSSWVRLREPTCTKPGEETATCTVCGTSATREIEALGHKFGKWTQLVAPTLGSEGEEIRYCSRCNGSDTRTVAPLKLQPPVIRSSVNTATGKPRVLWEAVDGAQFYRIYRSGSKSGDYKYLKTTSATSFTDTSAKVGKNYYYKVKSVNLDYDKVSGYSNVVNRVCDLQKPVVTANVHTTTGKPKLVWKDISGTTKYRIYRSTSKSGSYSLLKTTTSTTYIDTPAKAGKTYYYKVKALHSTSAADSAYSAVVSRVCDLAKPVLSITRKDGDPRISWKTVSGAEKYYIYRATSKTGEYTRVKIAVTARSYIDTSAKAGKTYYYKVRAIHSNAEANSAYSAVKSITAK